jgi:hypothetical protein
LEIKYTFYMPVVRHEYDFFLFVQNIEY